MKATSMMSPSADRRISLVVPCYNRAAYVNVLLQSLTWSAVPPSEFEVIVVNDGGVDHVGLVAENWRRRGLDVQVLQLRESGEPRNNAVARNAGTRAARYPIVVQTDPDIVFVTDVLDRVRGTLEPGIFCSASGYYPLTREATLDVAFGVGGPSADPAAYLARAAGRPNQALSPDGVGGLHGAFACAKADLERVEGYDESFAYWGWEDRELLVTLAHDAGLVRRHMAGITVVHLWHPTLRGTTSRWELAAQGQVSRAAWDVQMQRAAAEYPRSTRARPRARPPHAPAEGARPFEAGAYAEWLGEVSSDEARSLAYQMFFDAARMEAVQLRGLGCASLARDLLRATLQCPWEQRPLELAHYERVALVLEELAECDEDLGDEVARHDTLEALDRQPEGRALAAAARARSALRRGEREAARHELAHLHGAAWDASRAWLAIEIALLSGQPAAAHAILCAAATARDVVTNHFERLRFFAYRRLVARLGPSADASTTTIAVPPSPPGLAPTADEDRSEFLYSVAMRSMRSGLYIAAIQLLERFLRSGSPAEPRLFEEGRLHLAKARACVGLSGAPAGPSPQVRNLPGRAAG